MISLNMRLCAGGYDNFTRFKLGLQCSIDDIDRKLTQSDYRLSRHISNLDISGKLISTKNE